MLERPMTQTATSDRPASHHHQQDPQRRGLATSQWNQVARPRLAWWLSATSLLLMAAGLLLLALSRQARFPPSMDPGTSTRWWFWSSSAPDPGWTHRRPPPRQPLRVAVVRDRSGRWAGRLRARLCHLRAAWPPRRVAGRHGGRLGHQLHLDPRPGGYSRWSCWCSPTAACLPAAGGCWPGWSWSWRSRCGWREPSARVAAAVPVPDNPVGVTGGALGWLVEAFGQVGFQLFLATLPAAALSLALRFHRSRGVERQQLKWFAAAGLILVAVPVADTISPFGFDPNRLLELLSTWPLYVAIGIAILRYRLYDIDRLLNRTLVYGLLTVILGLGYSGAVLVAGQLSGGLGGQPPDWAVAGATLATAALFQPARRRVQAVLDLGPTWTSLWLRPAPQPS
jgi:hypothetical protein